jgi:hypothetical protein
MSRRLDNIDDRQHHLESMPGLEPSDPDVIQRTGHPLAALLEDVGVARGRGEILQEVRSL